MKLIDSSAWIEFYRKNGDIHYKEEIIKALKENDAAICGIIKIELLIHTKTIHEYNMLASDFSAIHWLESNEHLYSKASEIGFELKKKGITVPVTDLIVASCAVIYGAMLIHFDKHFIMINKYYPLKMISFNIHEQ